ncbi:MAG: NAD(P)H-dependent oxidoreductase [Thermodesulfobacteriota bacterium]
MMILGLQGSPRLKGNTAHLLSAFMATANKRGADTSVVEVPKLNLEPCRGCGFCEKKGRCVIEDDDMVRNIYPLLRMADAVVLATPIYFYNAPAQLKALIDRSQALWSRKYKLNLTDPKRRIRKGYLLAVGATKGKNLFEGMELTAKYFFDAIGAAYMGSLTYRRIEHPGDMAAHPALATDVDQAVPTLTGSLENRKTVIFACRENACRSQMAAAYASLLGGDRIAAYSAGSTPADSVNPLMEAVMAEEGIDMMYRTPRSLGDVLSRVKPDLLITMGCAEQCPFVPGAARQDWALPDPSGKSIEFMRSVRDEIKKQVQLLLESVSS